MHKFEHQRSKASVFLTVNDNSLVSCGLHLIYMYNGKYEYIACIKYLLCKKLCYTSVYMYCVTVLNLFLTESQSKGLKKHELARNYGLRILQNEAKLKQQKQSRGQHSIYYLSSTNI